YSGTVSGGMEGAIMGIPRIAVSVAAEGDARFDVAAEVAVRLVEIVRRHGLPPDTLLNVNVPNLPRSQARGGPPPRGGAGTATPTGGPRGAPGGPDPPGGGGGGGSRRRTWRAPTPGR